MSDFSNDPQFELNTTFDSISEDSDELYYYFHRYHVEHLALSAALSILAKYPDGPARLRDALSHEAAHAASPDLRHLYQVAREDLEARLWLESLPD